jgi:hypothetical protein
VGADLLLESKKIKENREKIKKIYRIGVAFAKERAIFVVPEQGTGLKNHKKPRTTRSKRDELYNRALHDR